MRLSLAQPAVAKAYTVPSWVRYILIGIGFIIAWQLYVSYGGVNPLLVASPIATIQALITDTSNGQLPIATFNSLQNLAISMAISMALGLALASLSTFFRFGRDILTVLTAVFSALPGIAILPLVMLWFGLTPTSIISWLCKVHCGRLPRILIPASAQLVQPHGWSRSISA